MMFSIEILVHDNLPPQSKLYVVLVRSLEKH